MQTKFNDSLSSTSSENYYRGFSGALKNYEYDYTNMGARLYDTESGRFLSVDPLFEFFPTQSPYGYAFNNPINFSDPSGLSPERESKNEEVQTLMIQQVVDEWGDVHIEIWESAADSPLAPAPVIRFAVGSHGFENPAPRQL